MSEAALGIALLVALLLLIWTGMHVGVALAALAVVGVWIQKGSLFMGGELLALAAYDAIAHHVFGVVPLFVLMGFLVQSSDLGRESFAFAQRVFGGVRGGLGVATVAANALFAAITGISIASAAVFTRVAIPEMLRFGYTPRFSVGVVAGSSVLGMLIPPSLLFIVFGLLTEVSIGSLFLAGVIPGVLLALLFAAMIVGAARWAPDFVGGANSPRQERESDASREPGMLTVAPIIGLGALVLGGIYGGIFTPSEAGAVGALLALLLALGRRRLTSGEFRRVLVETGHTTVSICFLIIAANAYARVLALTGVPQALVQSVELFDLGPGTFLFFYLAALILLGTVLDSTSILLVAVPLVLPLMQGMGLDLVWVGVMTVLAVEIGLLTPPLGIAVYVIHGTLGDDEVSLRDIFVGAAPFAAIMVLVLTVVALVPSLSTALLP